MSTKIHHGLILRKATLGKALELLKQVRQDVLPKAQTATARSLAQQMAFSLDMAHNYSGLKPGEKGFWVAQRKLREAQEQVQGKGERNTTWDSTFSICLIPKGKDLLALYYIEQDHGYVEALKKVGFEDYHYQNATDRPNDITPQAWGRRKRDWSVELPRHTTPAEVGLSYCVISWDDIRTVIFNRELVIASIPSEEDRRKDVATRLIEIEVAMNNPDMGLWEMYKLICELEPGRRDSVTLAPEAFG